MFNSSLILIGASVRAAAFSSLRAGLRPWCADLFGDLDLRRYCPVTIIPPERYPQGFVEIVANAPPGPWMYTGGLENSPHDLMPLWEARPCWGNAPESLTLVRSPFTISRIMHRAGLPTLRTFPVDPDLSVSGRWLLKPYRGAGGTGIRFWDGESLSSRVSTHFLQEFVEGTSGAALFLGAPPTAHLLGVTRQLVGESWLHSSSFHYCGSIGPWNVPEMARSMLQAIGQTLVRETNVRGLFGIDFILRDDVPWLVEINPRYTASVEVLEHALGLPALELHREVFVGTPTRWESVAADVVGKAIYFAPHTLSVPQNGPWTATLQRPLSVESMPDFADIPTAGQTIGRGRPVLTFFARAADEATCRDHLRQIAYNLDRLFLADEAGGE